MKLVEVPKERVYNYSNIITKWGDIFVKKRDMVFALLIAIVWGANFTVVKLGVEGVPSMLLVSLRYVIVALPAVFFIKKPDIEWKYIILYGLTVGVGQFSCLFYAIEIGMPAGLASILTQLQAFISPLFAWMILKEKLKMKQILGFLIASIGLFAIAVSSGTGDMEAISILAFVLTILVPVFWSLSNIVVGFISKEAAADEKEIDMLGLIVWSALIPPLPLLAFALMLDSPKTLIDAVINMNLMSIFAILYLGLGCTLFAYSMWSHLIAKYSIGKIAPLSLLIPITGLMTARIVLSEKLTGMQWVGAIIIIIGLMITDWDFKVMMDSIKRYQKKDDETIG
mgnify:CR=1 FL=1